jgi:hypothetical protein
LHVVKSGKSLVVDKGKKKISWNGFNESKKKLKN